MALPYTRWEEGLLMKFLRTCKVGTWPEVEAILSTMPWYLCVASYKNTGLTALHFACLGNNLEVAGVMLQVRGDVFHNNLYKKSMRNETPVDMACRMGHVRMAELLFRAAIDLGVQPDCTEGSVLHIACAHGRVDIVEMLLGIQHSLIHARTAWSDETPLHKAVQKGRVEVVRVLFNYGADVNCQTRIGDIPLHIATQGKQWNIMKLLLEHPNTDIEAEDCMGKTALNIACSLSDWQAVDLLLAHRANTNTRDARNTSPLHSAARWGESTHVRCLLEAGAEVNVVNVSHETPLSVASCGGHADMVRALLDAGAEMYVEGRCQAVSCARGLEQWHILRMLTATLIDRYTARGLGQMLVSQGMAWMVKRFSRH